MNTKPPLTTVRAPLIEMGQLAMRFLLDQIEGGSSRADSADITC